MKWCKLLAAGSVSLSMLTLTATPTQAQTCYGPEAACCCDSRRPVPGVVRVPLSPDRERILIIQRPVVEPAAVVSKELSQQPVYTHVAYVQVVNTPITVDPDDNFRRKTGGIDEHHYLREAQRQFRNAQAKPARVYWGARARVHRPQPLTIAPRAILLQPGRLDQDRPDGQQQPTIPTTPAPARETPPQLAQAD